ncbi:MAG: PAS domain S-box protein [Dehalococcoidales bacterium]
MANPHFWAVTVLFAICLVLQYPQQLLGLSSPSVFSFLGLTRHAIERIFLLVPVSYVSFLFGFRAGFFSITLAAAIMFPRVFLISQYFPDSIFETSAVIVVGVLINLWCQFYRKDRERQQHILSELKAAHEKLQQHAAIIEDNERRLDTLNHISGIISQSLDMGQILNSAINGIIASMHIEDAWIHLINDEENELVLTACRGNCQDFPRIKAGYGLSGTVAESGQPLFVGDISRDPRAPEAARRQTGSVLIVPFISKDKVKGTLGIGSRSYRTFQQHEIELLTGIGNQISVAIDNAGLYQTQQKVAEKLRTSEQRYRELFENAHDAILVHDMDGNITAANRAAEVLNGYQITEMIGMNVKTFLTEESLALAGQIKRKLLLGETVEQPYEQRLIKKGGTEAILQMATSLITENDQPIGFQHIARDITREKEIQAKLSTAYRQLNESHTRLKESQEQLIQAEKLTSLGQLAASIAHEINNPLSGVLIYTQLLIKKITSASISKETVLEYLSKMEFELTRSTRLVRNLLDFARQSAPDIRPVHLNDVINRAFDLAVHSADLQKIKAVKELDPSLPEIMADSDQLQQVFTNIILNALQAMPEGGTLTIVSSFNDGQFKIEIRDTGYGIFPENMRKIFVPFFTTKQEVKGVGLGLAIAYGIVQRHHGKIVVQSLKGEGTTFSIFLSLHG